VADFGPAVWRRQQAQAACWNCETSRPGMWVLGLDVVGQLGNHGRRARNGLQLNDAHSRAAAVVSRSAGIDGA
jgi:hypothetical protein